MTARPHNPTRPGPAGIPRTLRALAGGSLMAALAAVGCESAPEPAPWNEAPPARDLSSVVMPTTDLLAWERAPGTPSEAERFEFARRDAGLNIVRDEALRATAQWPLAPRPAERPVIFRRWRQR